MNARTSLMVAVVLVTGVGVALYIQRGNDRPVDGPPMAAVSVPALTGAETVGKEAFDANCAACHGADAAGQDGVAPPLVHIIYEPGHHADESFFRAVEVGVRAHHWSFGDMPPVDGLTRSDVAPIIAYIRALQRANGIN